MKARRGEVSRKRASPAGPGAWEAVAIVTSVALVRRRHIDLVLVCAMACR